MTIVWNSVIYSIKTHLLLPPVITGITSSTRTEIFEIDTLTSWNVLQRSPMDMNQKQPRKTMNMQIVQGIMVRAYLWPIIWMKPVVFSCRKMSGMTSARLSTHSKQCVFKMPCNFGRRKNTWLTNLTNLKWSCSYQWDFNRLFIYEMIYVTGISFKHKATPQTHRSINGGKCFDTLFKQIMNLSSMSFFFKFVILLEARLRSSWWSWDKNRKIKTNLTFM